MSNAVLVKEEGGRMLVTFNRPEIRSPLSRDVLSEIENVIANIRLRRDIERLVFTGAGDVFASGADLREIAQVSAASAAEFARRGQSIMQSIEDLNCDTIAAVNGYCFGGALDLALACRRRIASPNAQFAHPGAGLGIMTGWGGTQRLPRLIGEARALEMFLTTRRVAAEEAVQIGLVDQVVADPRRTALE